MIIGRKEEISKLETAYGSEYSEFVAVYGRRRIGKTFLVRETFGSRFTFQYTGVYDIPNKEQLMEFYTCMRSQGLTSAANPPKNWFEAFHMLESLIDRSKSARKVIFLDELPWMDAPNSLFIPAFEHFWNGWASARKDILLVICGSATSWIMNKVIYGKGGLYNRVTRKIPLKQFSLSECEELCSHRRLAMTRNMIMEGYMVMGGVPYYWTQLNPAKSMSKNINDLFLMPDGELHNEFNYIYSSMFKSPDKYIKVIEALSGKKSGLTRDEIIKKGGLESNGKLTKILKDLIGCGFVRKYCHTNKHVKDALYQLVDCYSLFYYQFVTTAHNVDEEYWVRLADTPRYNTWCGLSFERVCLLHTRQMKAAMGITGVTSNIFSWHVKGDDIHPGVQIDMLIDRADNIVNVCEMKYAPNGYSMTAAALKNIQTKMAVLRQHTPAKKAISPVLVTSNGVIRNKYSDEITLQITGDDLFRP